MSLGFKEREENPRSGRAVRGQQEEGSPRATVARVQRQFALRTSNAKLADKRLHGNTLHSR